jgi:hypothetical protein
MGEHEVTKAAEVYERDPSSVDEAAVATSESLEGKEVFGKAGAEVDFRTVGWPMASVIFFKRKSRFTHQPGLKGYLFREYADGIVNSDVLNRCPQYSDRICLTW